MPLPRGRIVEVLWWVHRQVWNLSGGRIGTNTAGLPVLELTTTGRRSGEPRSALIHHLRVGDAFVVIGSNVGRDHPPAWALNLQSNPRATVTVGGRSVPMTARVATGEERERLWRMAVEAKDDYRVYTTRTDRELPVFVLDPAASTDEP